jgi:hypothetical protein
MLPSCPAGRGAQERLARIGDPIEGRKENGAGDEIRTHDINLGKVALYP